MAMGGEQDSAAMAEMLRALVEHAPIGMALHRDRRPLYCNTAFAEGHGLTSPAEFLALDSIDALPLSGGAKAVPVMIAGEPATALYLRDQHEQSIRETLDRYSDALRITDADDRIRFTNRRFHELFPASPPPEEIIGQDFSTVIRRTIMTGEVAIDLALADPEAYIRHRMAERAALTGRHANQVMISGRWHHVIEERTRTGAIVTVYSDIHDRKRAEDALSHAMAEADALSARLRAAIEALPSGFLMLDEQMNYLAWNKAFEAQINQGLVETKNLLATARLQAKRGDYNRIRLNPAAFTPEQIRDTPGLATLLRCQATRRVDEQMGEEEIEAYLKWAMLIYQDAVRPDGFHWSRPGEIRVASTGRIIELRRNRVQGVGWVQLYTDVTDMRAAETALRTAKESAETMLAELQRTQARLVQSQKLAALGQLVAGVAHEVNTPLGVALTAASQLVEEVRLINAALDAGTLTKSRFTGFINKTGALGALLTRNCERAAELVRRFKTLAADGARDARRAVELSAFCRTDFASGIRALLKTRAIAVVIDIPEPIEIETYPGTLYQVLQDLAGNAVIHAFRMQDTGTLTISAHVLGDEVEIAVRDDGGGIAPDVLPRIFDPFFTTNRSAGNAGLGLHILHNLVTGPLGGAITVESGLGEGTVFRLRLPRGATQG